MLHSTGRNGSELMLYSYGDIEPELMLHSTGRNGSELMIYFSGGIGTESLLVAMDQS